MKELQLFTSNDLYQIYLSSRDGNLPAFAGILASLWSLGSFSIRLNFGRNFWVYMYLRTASCRWPALQPRSRLPFYPDSVCPELAWRRTILKWPSVSCIHVFRGGLLATLWQVRIGLRSFINMILASCTEGCTRKLFCCVRSSPCGPRSASMYETSPVK